LMFRASMSGEVERIGCLEARCIWSMWPGYLRDLPVSGSGVARAARDPDGHPSASGHAFIAGPPAARERTGAGSGSPDLIRSRRIVSKTFFPQVERRRDGEWWEV
jgi:hypothetical protein